MYLLRPEFHFIKFCASNFPTANFMSQKFYCTKPPTTRDTELLEFQERFERIRKKNEKKDDFLIAIDIFRESRGKRGRGHVEFIETALKHLKEFNLHKDLDVYKALLNVFPKGPMIPQNAFQKMFVHYPVQQVCTVRLLDEMEWNHVQPDKEIHDIVCSIFGEYNFASKKAKRQLYWMPKLKHTNKYLDRRQVEGKNLTDAELARLALKMMCRDAGTSISFLKAETDGSWILSAQSPLQRRIVSGFTQGTSCFVDGPSQVWVMDKPVQYVVLSSTPMHSQDEDWVDLRSIHDYSDLHERLHDLVPGSDLNIHQQSDQTILGMAVFQYNNNQNALSWVNHLISNGNPWLARTNILFRVQEEVDLQVLGHQQM